MPLGTSMVRVRATDPSENSCCGYQICLCSPEYQFNLDHNRGEMRTLSTLGYDEIKTCSMVWEARNGGRGGLIA